MKTTTFILALGFFSGSVASGLSALHDFAMREDFAVPLYICGGFLTLFVITANLLRRAIEQERQASRKIKRLLTVTEMLEAYRTKPR